MYLTAAPSPLDGTGVFAARPLAARRKIGEVGGRLVRLPEARRLVQGRRRIYLVELDERMALDCSGDPLLGRLNHHCAPNCFLRIRGHVVEVYALRRIAAGEELTVDYGETPHRRGMRCTCGAPTCRHRI